MTRWVVMTDIFGSPSGGAGAEVMIPRTCRWEFGMLIIIAFQVVSVSKANLGSEFETMPKIRSHRRKERPRFQLNEAEPKDVPLADLTTSPEHGS